AFFLGSYVLEFIAKPVEEQLGEFYDRRAKKIMEEIDSDPDLIKLNKPKEVVEEWSRKDIETIFNRKLNNDTPALSDGKEWVPITNRFRPLKQEIETRKAREILSRRPALSTLSVQEAFVVYFKVSLMTGFVLASPWIFYQIWSFIAAGLYPHEK